MHERTHIILWTGLCEPKSSLKGNACRQHELIYLPLSYAFVVVLVRDISTS